MSVDEVGGLIIGQVGSEVVWHWFVVLMRGSLVF
jgi:hypothetical protein